MSNSAKTSKLAKYLSDSSIPIDQRQNLFRTAIAESGPATEELVNEAIKRFEAAYAQSQYEEKLAALNALLKDLDSGPLRQAVFVSLEPPIDAASSPRGSVIVDDGTQAFCAIPVPGLAEMLVKGDRVLLDARGTAVLGKVGSFPNIGEEAVFERLVGDGSAEVTIHDKQKSVFLLSKSLEERIKACEVAPGDTLVVNPRQYFAYDALPKADALSHYQFLVRGPVPSVKADRDMGNPPPIIESIAEMVRQEMTTPELRRRFGLRRSKMVLFTGKPGTGKSFTIEAIQRSVAEIVSEVTGVPIDELPPRVFRFRPSKILSEWLGRADKNVDRFFDEIEQMAAERWTAPDGVEHELPVLVILEEIDGIARTRGREAIYDRILTGILQRLDPNRSALKEKLVIWVGTTNEASQVDGAFLRRIGGEVVHFKGLNRNGFASVLSKLISRLPVSHNGSKDPHASLVSDLAAWLFGPSDSNPAVVELTYAGATTTDTRYRRDFLTGALIDRAVQRAAERAALEASQHSEVRSVLIEHFVEALDRQILATVDQLSEQNVHKFLDLPDASRVATLRRLPQPSQFPLQLQSN